MTAPGDQPWLAHYDRGLPHDLEVRHGSALAMFRASAARVPDRPAIQYFTTPLTFREADELSDALSAALSDLGVAPGDRVAVHLQNVPQFLLAMLATWKAGAILVSANAMYKDGELRLLLLDSGAVALITLESLWNEVGRRAVDGTAVKAAITTSPLDFLEGEVPPVLAGCERERDPQAHDLLELTRRFAGRRAKAPEPGPADVAFLTYTSGTTGPPKGAMNTHGNVVFNAHAYERWVGLTPDDVLLGMSPLFHITGLVAHLGVGMLVGIPIVLHYRFAAATVLELIEHHGATFTIGAITMYVALLSEPGERPLPTFRKLLTGGAPVAPRIVEDFERRFGGYIHNCYGLTETTSPTHIVPMAARAPVDPRTGALSIGVPIFGTTARVLDAEGRALPAGEVGELELAGPQVVPGYWGKPEETAHALPGGALRTGDVGFMDEQGWFYIVDRMKDQINTAGFKVWPRDVEDVLYAHPAVREAAVVGVPDDYRGETVKAFVSLRPGTEASGEELIGFCRERMAAYKYPREVVVLEELPKTASGKILRRQLREDHAHDPG